jgi:hypothetical protein
MFATTIALALTFSGQVPDVGTVATITTQAPCCRDFVHASILVDYLNGHDDIGVKKTAETWLPENTSVRVIKYFTNGVADIRVLDGPHATEELYTDKVCLLTERPQRPQAPKAPILQLEDRVTFILETMKQENPNATRGEVYSLQQKYRKWFKTYHNKRNQAISRVCLDSKYSRHVVEAIANLPTEDEVIRYHVPIR